MGDKVWCFNLPRSTCEEFRTPLCNHFCYARGNNFLWPEVQKGFARNLKQSKAVDFIASIHIQLNSIKNKGDDKRTGNRVRLHSSGDFYSQQYFNSWCHIASANSETLFLAYTRNVEIDFSNRPDNFRIFFSVDWSSKAVNPTLKQFAFMDTKSKTVPKHMSSYPHRDNSVVCNSHCYECKHCWKTKKNIVFYYNTGSRVGKIKAQKARAVKGGQVYFSF